MNAPDFWNDQKKAQNIIKETNFLKNLIASYEKTEAQVSSCIETAEELKKSFDEELMMLLEEEYAETMKQFESFEINVLLSHPYDKNNAILELHPGAGGTEAWTGLECFIECIQDGEKRKASKSLCWIIRKVKKQA